MKAKKIPSVRELRRMFSYDKATGQLIRKYNPNSPGQTNTRYADKPAGCLTNNGYVVVAINRRMFLAHRVIWKMVHGTEPEQIDHRDRNPLNNRINNLRAATQSQNMCNRPRTRGKALPKGVFPLRGRFQVKLRANKKNFYVGSYSTLEEANAAYLTAAKFHHGEFAWSDGL